MREREGEERGDGGREGGEGGREMRVEGRAGGEEMGRERVRGREGEKEIDCRACVDVHIYYLSSFYSRRIRATVDPMLTNWASVRHTNSRV